MRHAEDVTFGGSGLDRADDLRGQPEALAEAMRAPGSRSVLIWRGKPLVSDGDTRDIVRLPLDHPVFETAGPPILLGREDEGLIFGRELLGWSPDDLDEAALNSFADPSEQRHPLLGDDLVFAELRRVMTRLSPRDAELAATHRALIGWHASHGFCAKCGAASEMAQAGWQRRCGSCGAAHFPRTDPVVIMLVTRGPYALLGRSPGWPEGMYSCLAGFVEPGETLEGAVRREVAEEAGIRIGAVRYLASQPWPFPASLMIGCHAEAETEEIVLDPVELEDARWVTREQIVAAMAGEDKTLLPARKGAIAQFLLRNWLADRLDRGDIFR
ncbi:NAD(+) diphosphatase [Litorisediminicola beolgyonensis]|uniref:NAD(+) diphosphatase n=1 Tax=Litorisediminicola beolgyonensis TaxID=1173614 RepID=A0ABW3ZEP9_9RHOB